MQSRRVGTAGRKVSAVSVGGLITLGNTIPNDAPASILRAAVDAWS